MTEKVRSQLEAVRISGKTNMFLTTEVQRLAYERGFYELVTYIEENQKGYVHFILTGEELPKEK